MAQPNSDLLKSGSLCCPAQLQKLRHRITRKAQSLPPNTAKVLASNSRHHKVQQKPGSKSHQPFAKVRTSQAQTLTHQQSLMAPMGVFLQRLGWSMRRMLPSKAFRKSISSRRLDPRSYMLASVSRKSRKGPIGPPAPLHQPAAQDAKIQRSTLPSKPQSSSRKVGTVQSTAGASIPAASSSLPAASKSSALPFLTEDTGAALDGRHKPVGLVFVSAHTLATICHISGKISHACLPCSTCIKLT